MDTKDLENLTKLRLHMRANPELGAKISEAISEVAKGIGIDFSKELYGNLIVIHRSELDTDISVVLPVGSQCGF